MTVTALLFGGPAHGQITTLPHADLELRIPNIPGSINWDAPVSPVVPLVYEHYRRGPLIPLPGGHVPYYHVQSERVAPRVVSAVVEVDPDPADAAFDRLVAATDALLGTVIAEHYPYSSVDQRTYDFHADLCWRCDAVRATTDVGLCGGCRDDLAGET